MISPPEFKTLAAEKQYKTKIDGGRDKKEL